MDAFDVIYAYVQGADGPDIYRGKDVDSAWESEKYGRAVGAFMVYTVAPAVHIYGWADDGIVDHREFTLDTTGGVLTVRGRNGRLVDMFSPSMWTQVVGLNAKV
jgi:hypothetical protein